MLSERPVGYPLTGSSNGRSCRWGHQGQSRESNSDYPGRELDLGARVQSGPNSPRCSRQSTRKCTRCRSYLQAWLRLMRFDETS
jgi:hypothetical protein